MSTSPLSHALDLWAEITGVDTSDASIRLSSWQIRETFNALKEALELDPTEITANLLLAHFVHEYLELRSVSLLSLLNEPEAVAAMLEKPRRLLTILNRAEIIQTRDDFIAALFSALARYDAAEREDVGELLARADDIAVLRRDALRSMATLRVDQFLDGAGEPEDVRPVYNRMVHQWWNVNSMLAAATRMPSGVSLNLIRHPDAFQSYFCFVIRNGGNLFVLTDVPKYAHPLQGFMSRRPDRELDRRAARNRFPYDLLGVAYDEESERLYIKESEVRGLVAYQNAALPLQPVADLAPDELVWVSMMFDLIVEKFWRRDYRAPALSYTAEMLKSDVVLLDAARTANLPVAAYNPVGLPALSKADMLTDSLTDDEVGHRHHQPNRWMEARYAARVPDEVLNLVAAPEHVFALDHAKGDVSQMEAGFHHLSDVRQNAVLAGRRRLHKVDATSFGSREQLERDRKFIARVNFARHIGVLALEEFRAREKAVVEWYQARVQANVQNLLRWAGNTELWLEDGLHGTFSGYAGQVGSVRWREGGPRKRSFLARYKAGTDSDRLSGVRIIGPRDGHRPICYLNGTKASYWVVFSPATPRELALLAGCEVAELPDVLQHWTLAEPYTGNSILGRVDPMIWAASNPWLKLDLRVRLAFSRRGMAKIDAQPAERPPLPNYASDEQAVAAQAEAMEEANE